jgi:hypothetical protein
LAIEWVEQLRHLQQSLRADPRNSQAWRWRIRVKVLTYLVLRYGGDPSADLKAARVPLRPMPAIRDISSIYGAPVRTRRELLEVLGRIAEINRLKADLTAT